MDTKKKKKKNHLPLRLNLLFLFVFVLFSVLILRLGQVQIVNGQNYLTKVNATNQQTVSTSTDRGIIYDDKYNVLVNNKRLNAVVYIRKPGTTPKEQLQIAEKLAKYIHVDTSKVKERDEKDYWILSHDHGPNDNAYTMKLSPAEMKLKNAYKLLLSRITKSDLQSITKNDMQVIAIKRQLDQSSNFSPHYVKVGLTNEELATIGEHLSEFNGTIKTSLDYQRQYPKGQFFFLGQVGDIPQDQIDEYLAKGYHRDDKVGVSYLEQQYENVLRGIPTQTKFTTKNGQLVAASQETEGRRGDDLVLTIDSQLQKAVGNILERDIKWDLQHYYALDGKYFNSAYAVVMNPNTGGIKAISGRMLQKNGKFANTSFGAVYSAFQVGSSVKGATELIGFQHHAVPTLFNDKPFHMKGTHPFSSYTPSIHFVNPVTALERSSNVFMGRIAGNMAGFHFNDVGPYYKVSVNNGPKFQKAFKEMRDGYSQFGLGVKTGVDLPSEGLGYKGPMPIDHPGKIFYYAIGQYDTYTPLQMAQYVSTIANGGYRIQPHFLSSIHAPDPHPNEIGPTIKTIKPNVLNRIVNPESNIKTVQKGFYMVTHGPFYVATAAPLGHGKYAKYKIAAKTGTAQVNTKVVPNVYNLALASYAPYDHPEVAVVVIVPNIRSEGLNERIAGDIYQEYYKLKNGQ